MSGSRFFLVWDKHYLEGEMLTIGQLLEVQELVELKEDIYRINIIRNLGGGRGLVSPHQGMRRYPYTFKAL